MSTPEGLDERWWRDNLAGRHRGLRLGRTLFRRLPHEPRCKLCAAPFAGPGSLLMRPIGKVPWPRNPKYCASCFHNMERWRGGTELECSLLFADVRGSTAMAEQMRPSEMRALMDRFYTTASRVLVDHDAIVDKFVGDEVIGSSYRLSPAIATLPGPSQPREPSSRRPVRRATGRGCRWGPASTLASHLWAQSANRRSWN